MLLCRGRDGAAGPGGPVPLPINFYKVIYIYITYIYIWGAGDVVVRQGRVGRSLFLIDGGQAHYDIINYYKLLFSIYYYTGLRSVWYFIIVCVL